MLRGIYPNVAHCVIVDISFLMFNVFKKFGFNVLVSFAQSVH